MKSLKYLILIIIFLPGCPGSNKSDSKNVAGPIIKIDPKNCKHVRRIFKRGSNDSHLECIDSCEYGETYKGECTDHCPGFGVEEEYDFNNPNARDGSQCILRTHKPPLLPPTPDWLEQKCIDHYNFTSWFRKKLDRYGYCPE